jgi:hypothetical protein
LRSKKPSVAFRAVLRASANCTYRVVKIWRPAGGCSGGAPGGDARPSLRLRQGHNLAGIGGGLEPLVN